MKNLKVILPLLFFMTLVSCSQLKLQSQWNPLPEETVLNSADWDYVTFSYNEDPAFVTGAMNNDSTLNVIVRFNDPMFARLMASRGFTLWLGNKNNFGIDFMGRMNEGPPSNRRINRGMDTTQARNIIPFKPLDSNDFTVINKKSGAYLSVAEIKNLNAGLSKQAEVFTLEFTVPNQTINSMNEGEMFSGNTINATLHIKELERPTERSTTGRQEPGMGNAMRGGGRGSGGMRGGGRGSGGMQGGRPGVEQRPDTGSKEYKMKIILAENN